MTDGRVRRWKSGVGGRAPLRATAVPLLGPTLTALLKELDEEGDGDEEEE